MLQKKELVSTCPQGLCPQQKLRSLYSKNTESLFLCLDTKTPTFQKQSSGCRCPQGLFRAQNSDCLFFEHTNE